MGILKKGDDIIYYNNNFNIYYKGVFIEYEDDNKIKCIMDSRMLNPYGNYTFHSDKKEIYKYTKELENELINKGYIQN